MDRVSGLGYPISDTTRAPRGGEVHGREYYFLSEADFRHRIAQQEYLEYAEVRGGKYYGTSKSELARIFGVDKDVLTDIDVQGNKQFRALEPATVSVLLLPPSRQDLEDRLLTRTNADELKAIDLGKGFDRANAEAANAEMVAKAQWEIMQYMDFDYVVINDSVEVAVLAMIDIINFVRWSRRPGVSIDETKVAVSRFRTENMTSVVQQVLATF